MKSISQILASLALLVSMAACAPVEKKVTNSDQSKNTQEKTSSLEDSLEALGRVESAVALLHNQAAPIDDDLVQEIKNKLDVPQCVITYDKSTATEGDRKSILKIAGDSCNFSANYSLSYTVKHANLIAIEIIASFFIKEALTDAKNGIYKIDIRGSGTIKSSDSKILTNINYNGNAWVKSKDALAINFTHINTKSAVNPNYQSYGTSSLLINFPAEKKTIEGNEVVIASYQMELKKMKSIMAGKDLSTFTLNSSAIDEVTYDKYMRHLGFLSFNQEI